jgi:hypothetical protein
MQTVRDQALGALLQAFRLFGSGLVSADGSNASFSRNTKHTYPASLDELAPQYLSALPPHDVMNGEPFHYRRTAGGGYLLSSVGPNLIDDGGLPDSKDRDLNELDGTWPGPSGKP